MVSKTKFCLALSNTFNLGEIEQMEKFYNHGIDGFFPLYVCDEQIYKLAEFAGKKGLFFQSIHAKHQSVYSLWCESDATAVMEDLKNTIKCSSKVGVNRVIIHPCAGVRYKDPTLMGLKRFGDILECANKYGVYLCFENLEGTQILDAILNEYNNCENAKLCYDCGHENCYATHKVVDKYKDKIFTLHINDNVGIRSEEKVITPFDDLHLLPFDGNVNFERVVKLIKHAKLENELTFELKIHKDSVADKYRKMDFDDYLTLATQRMKKVASML
jgi:sugar phosphate isomerase/epimerase